jgi:hypothetical protein
VHAWLLGQLPASEAVQVACAIHVELAELGASLPEPSRSAGVPATSRLAGLFESFAAAARAA